MIHYPHDRTPKLATRFEVRSFFSRGNFPKCGHLAIPAKLHGPKGDRINESLLYNYVCIFINNYMYADSEMHEIKNLSMEITHSP